jgi:pyruvate/2-oxoglutarate/acetoin dehydrogenase E1 component
MSNRTLSYTDAIREATAIAMERDKRVHVMGLGVTYPGGADGTTGGLVDAFPGRVHDIPVSESAATGLCVGSAISGLRPIIHHGRVEFAFYAADQIFTQAAKWNYMFGGDYPCPIVFRIAIGRQWGNGPQHTQVVHSMFGQVPGLKVVIPTSPYDAKGLLLAAIEDSNPVVYLEHRWLYKLQGDVPEGYYTTDLSSSQVVRSGTDITIVATADTLLEAVKAAGILASQGLQAEIIDLVSVNPIDYKTILASAKKTGRLLVADVSTPAFGIGREINSVVAENLWAQLKGPPRFISCPDAPCPTATSLTETYYPIDVDIANTALEMIGNSLRLERRRSFEDFHLPPKYHFNALIGESLNTNSVNVAT